MTRTIEPMFSGDLWFLSNFHPIAFWVPQLAAVPSGEHAFNALKTTNAGERQRVLSQPSPGLAKRVGSRSRCVLDGTPECACLSCGPWSTPSSIITATLPSASSPPMTCG